MIRNINNVFKDFFLSSFGSFYNSSFLYFKISLILVCPFLVSSFLIYLIEGGYEELYCITKAVREACAANPHAPGRFIADCYNYYSIHGGVEPLSIYDCFLTSNDLAYLNDNCRSIIHSYFDTNAALSHNIYQGPLPEGVATYADVIAIFSQAYHEYHYPDFVFGNEAENRTFIYDLPSSSHAFGDLPEGEVVPMEVATNDQVAVNLDVTMSSEASNSPVEYRRRAIIFSERASITYNERLPITFPERLAIEASPLKSPITKNIVSFK